ncbi:mitofilin family membrane protein [Hoeflea sp. AS16]|uniref:COG4223 family protein n=1 Tax=Hoeflea sp. AS16 TaxID=3135779 RepID=UPI00316D1100
MSKGPTPRHSKSPKPVTIDLDATDVTPKGETSKAKPSATGPAVARTPDPVEPNKTDSKAVKSGGTDAAGKSDSTSKPAPDLKSDPKIDPKAGSKPDASAQPAKAPDSAKTADPKDSKSADTKPKPATAGSAGAASAKPAAAPSKSGGGVGMVMSGLIGAVIALGGGYALQAGGILPAPGAGSDQVAPVASRVDALSSQVESLSAQVSASGGADASAIPAELSARLDSLEADLAKAAENSAGDGSDPAALSALENRLAGLESKIAELADAGVETAADPALAAEMSEMKAAQSGLQASLVELQSRSDALASKISELEQAQQKLSEQVDAPSRQIDLARAIAATGLKSAIDRGGSFTSELEAFASVAPDDPAVAELRDLATRGVPSRAELVAGFSDAASKAIAAANPGDPEAGLVDRLMSSAMSVVKVRKVGDVAGDSVEAIVARAETRLLNGDLDAAVSEWNTLPEASRAAASDYGNALAARARAEKLIAAAMAPSAASAAPAN